MNKLLFLKDPVFYFALIVALTFVSSYTGGIGYMLYYPMLFAALYYNNKNFKKNNSSSVFGLFLLTCLISILFNYNRILPVFQAPFRFMAFSVLIIAFTPILSSVKKNIYCYRFMLYSCILLVFVGFINYYAYRTGALDIGEGNRVYAGTIGTNYLGMLCSIGIVYLSSLLMFYKNIKKYILIISIFLILGLIICLLLSSSRNSIISIMISMVFMFYIKFKGNISKIISLVSILVVISISTFPYWQEYTLGIADKQGGNFEELDMKSRKSHWTNRYNEFKSSPIIGIGFANISNPSEFSRKTGIIETTTGWGALFSQLGIIGAFLFISLTIKNLLFLLNHKKARYLYCLLMGLLVFFCVNSIGEGYITTVGCQFTVYFWTVQGVIYALRKGYIKEEYLNNYFIEENNEHNNNLLREKKGTAMVRNLRRF